MGLSRVRAERGNATTRLAKAVRLVSRMATISRPSLAVSLDLRDVSRAEQVEPGVQQRAAWIPEPVAPRSGHRCRDQPELVALFRNTIPASRICFPGDRRTWLRVRRRVCRIRRVPGDGIRDTGVNMLGRSRISPAARAEKIRGCSGYSLSHARRINRKWLSEQRPKSVNKVFLAISGRTVCHSTCRRNHDYH